MWIAEILSNTNHVINEYLLRGPELKIGRLNGDGYIPIIQNNDKTISRDHARVNIDSDILTLTDNNSKFGTFIDEKNTKITESYQVKSGQTIKFGAALTRVRFIKCNFVFSTTLISKDERERIKKLSKVLGARISNNVEDSSHLICPKYGATTKMLTAIVMEKKIITVNWLSFIEETTTFTLIPKCIEYSPPATDEFSSYIATSHLHRSELLKNYTIFITTKTDMQYGPIFKQCGTNLIDLSHIDDKTILKRAIKDTNVPNDTSVVCIFYDMINYKTTSSSVPISSVAPIVDSSFLSENDSVGYGEENIPLLWLSAEKLAVAIIKCEEPELTRYFMTSNRSQVSSQKSFTANYQFDTLNQHAVNSPIPPKSPSANPKLNISIPTLVRPTNMKENGDNLIEFSKPLVPVFVTDSQKSKHSPLKAQSHATIEIAHDEIREEVVISSEKMQSTTKRGRYDEDDDKVNVTNKKRRESKASINNDSQDYQLSNGSPCEIRMTDDNIGTSEYDEEIEEFNVDPYLELQALQDYENRSENIAADNDGWIAPPPLNLRKAISEKNRKTLDDEYKYLEPAETKRVKNLIRKVVLDSNKRISNKYSRNPKDQRKFKKNIIFFATEDELLYCRDMDKVLPKESSREKQLRMEEEALEEELISDEEEDDVIMATHFGKKKTTRRKK